jgi:hypothetical protein
MADKPLADAGVNPHDPGSTESWPARLPALACASLTFDRPFMYPPCTSHPPGDIHSRRVSARGRRQAAGRRRSLNIRVIFVAYVC